MNYINTPYIKNNFYFLSEALEYRKKKKKRKKYYDFIFT